jgi:hypothetical protein
MNPWRNDLRTKLEPILRERDAARQLCVKSGYHDLPYGILVYPPEKEFELRRELTLLRTRLHQAGKHVTTISLSECMTTALAAEGLGAAELVEAEIASSLPLAIETVFAVLSSYRPLDELVAERVPSDADPERDVVFLVRAGALYPLYRTYALLEQLKGRVSVPTVLMYPGDRVGPKGLSFMGVADPEHNYRPWIVE